MSDYDDMDLDEDELNSMAEQDETQLSPEDVFSMVMVNTHRRSKIHTELQDAEGDEINLADVMTQITGYINDKMGDRENNQFADQIMPLMSQACISVLGRMLGNNATGFLLSNPMTRDAIIFSMCSSFLLLKWVQQKNVTLHTIEEEVTQDEIDTILRKSQANTVATMGSLMGEDPRDILKELHRQGKITSEDITDILGKNGVDDDNEGSDLN